MLLYLLYFSIFMKHSFKCFYDVTDSVGLEKIWKDNNTIFILDTNVLLNLYSFQPNSRKDFFRVLNSIQDRIWIPFHVGLEFQKNRLNIIKKRRNIFNDLNKSIENLAKTVSFDKKPFTTLQTQFSLKKNHPQVSQKLNTSFQKIDELFNKLQKELKTYLDEIQSEVDNTDNEKLYVNSHDFIREEIDSIFTENKVGKHTFNTQEKLNTLYKEGTQRYENKIPPGFEDAKEKGEEEFHFDGLTYKSKFGDLIIFKQIIEYAKKNEIKNVIFISEDRKEDWRHIEQQNGEKTLGARFELKKELYEEAKVENFLIYQIEEFIKKTDEYLDIKIEKETLTSIKRTLENEKVEDSQKTKNIKAQIIRKLMETQNKKEALEAILEQGKKEKEIYKNNPALEAMLEQQKKMESIYKNNPALEAMLEQQKKMESIYKNNPALEAMLEQQKKMESIYKNNPALEAMLEQQKKSRLLSTNYVIDSKSENQ